MIDNETLLVFIILQTTLHNQPYYKLLTPTVIHIADIQFNYWLLPDIQCTVYRVHCTVYSVHCISGNVHYTVYGVHPLVITNN